MSKFNTKDILETLTIADEKIKFERKNIGKNLSQKYLPILKIFFLYILKGFNRFALNIHHLIAPRIC